MNAGLLSTFLRRRVHALVNEAAHVVRLVGAVRREEIAVRVDPVSPVAYKADPNRVALTFEGLPFELVMPDSDAQLLAKRLVNGASTTERARWKVEGRPSIYEGHTIPDDMTVWSIGLTPRDAVQAFCRVRLEGELEGELSPLEGDSWSHRRVGRDPRFTWSCRFLCDGTSFKAAGIDVPGGVILTWWK